MRGCRAQWCIAGNLNVPSLVGSPRVLRTSVILSLPRGNKDWLTVHCLVARTCRATRTRHGLALVRCQVSLSCPRVFSSLLWPLAERLRRPLPGRARYVCMYVCIHIYTYMYIFFIYIWYISIYLSVYIYIDISGTTAWPSLTIRLKQSRHATLPQTNVEPDMERFKEDSSL